MLDKMNAQQIEERIVSAIRAIPKPPTGAQYPETKAIKLAIGTLGEELGFKVCGLPAGKKEWLYDLCWHSRSSLPDSKLLDVPLVLESEWTQYEIEYDFEKLLVAKSKFKVMVFQANGQTAIDYLQKLEQRIRTYQGGSSGEIYLLACYDGPKGKFEIKKIERT
jgi:hypothetical protein